jgi:hypothetical protein
MGMPEIKNSANQGVFKTMLKADHYFGLIPLPFPDFFLRIWMYLSVTACIFVKNIFNQRPTEHIKQSHRIPAWHNYT